MEPALVSVIIPVYNGARFLAEAIESALAQDHRPIELIVVDDGSTDGSAAIARAHPEVRLLQQPNAGVATARNAGVAAARGELIAFLDQDDRWLSGKLSVQLACHRAAPDLAYTLVHQRFVTGEGSPPPGLRPALLRDHPSFAPSAWMVRKEAFARIGTFDAQFAAGSDTDWLLRAKDAGLRSWMLPETYLLKRLHEENHSQDFGLLRGELLLALRRSIGRQRAGATP